MRTGEGARHIDHLTGLRGLAALIVFVSHSANAGLLPQTLGRGYGQLGVLIFFVLSGFLMTHLYIGKPFRIDTARNYALARIARVFPLYFAMLAVSILVSQLMDADSWYPYVFLDPVLIATSLAMVKSTYVFWSVPVEVQFYVVFVGLWALVARGTRWEWCLSYLIAVSIPSALLYVFFGSLPNVVSKYSHAFVIGILVAIIRERVSASDVGTRIADMLGFAFLVLLLLNMPQLRQDAGLTIGESQFVRIWLDPVTLALAGSLVLFAAMESSSLGWLRSGVLRYLGGISYGFYLLHSPILEFFIEHSAFGSAGILLASFSGAVFASHLSLVLFEQPVSAYVHGVRAARHSRSR